MGQRLTEEAHAAQHDPRADERRAHRGESTAHNVVRMNSLSVNGVTHHDHGSVRNRTGALDLGGLRSTSNGRRAVRIAHRRRPDDTGTQPSLRASAIARASNRIRSG